MAKTNYAADNLSENTAKAYGKSLPISLKTSINVANKLRGMSTAKAIAYLDRVTQLKQAVPFTRFTDGVGHRKGKMAAGRFPVKAAKEIGIIIASAVANAANKGLSEDLKIIHICAHKAASQFHMGRQRRRMMKQTHIEVVIQEVEVKEKSKAKVKAKSAPKPKPKQEIKKPSKEPKELVKEVSKDAPKEEKEPVKSSESNEGLKE